MIFRLFVQKNNLWQELDLPTDFNLALTQNSGFLGKIQAGSFSFTSSLPTTQNNCTILQNVENPQMVADRKIQLPAKLLYGSTEYYSWYFVLRRANEKLYSYDLIQTPGNQPRNFYDKKLWQLDFGKLDLQSTTKKSNIWAIDIYGSSVLYQYFISQTPVYFEIWVNGVFVVSPPIGQTSSGNDVEHYFYTEKDPEKRFIIATKNITDYVISLNIPTHGRGSINVIEKSRAITSVKIKIYQYSRLSSIIRGPFVAEHSLLNLSYNDVNNSIDSITKQQDLYPFKFLTYFNDSFYPADNTQYEGIVNQYKDDTIDGNESLLKLNDGTINALNSYPISPCFSITFILEKIAKMMGFTLNSEIFQHKAASADYYLGDLHFINNIDFAEQLTGTTIPVNIYSNTITYSNFMPDITVKEFLDALRTTFCLSIDYQYSIAQIVIKKGKDIIKSENVIDISDKLIRIPTAEIIDKTYYQLGFKNADSNAIAQQDYPTSQTIADNGRSYTKIEAGFTPVLNNIDLDEFQTYDPNPYIPTINETPRSVIYLEQKNIHPAPRITFFLGTGNNGISFVAKSDNKNEKICLSWTSTNTHKGLLEMFYQEYLDFLNTTTQWVAEVWLTELELAYFDFTTKYYAYGMLFLAESLNPKLPVKTTTAIKLLSV